jgi:hypothetical protein
MFQDRSTLHGFVDTGVVVKVEFVARPNVLLSVPKHLFQVDNMGSYRGKIKMFTR